MSDALVLMEETDGIVVLTINRPKALNALNSEVIDALGECVAACESDEDLRCVIVTGAGGRAFVAGADIGQMADLTPAKAAYFAARGHAVFARLSALPVPVIAAVNGFCLGGGCELSLACDLVYASQSAKFGQPEVKLGLIPGFGGTQRLARRVGAMRATELVSTGRMIDADEAMRIGLCLEVIDDDALMETVLGVAQTIAKRAPVAVKIAKRVQGLGLEAPLATANHLEIEAFGNLFDTEDAREGMSAFVEKRPAAFKNR